MAKHTTNDPIEQAIQHEEKTKDLENNNNYFFVKKMSQWTLFRSFAIIFLILAVLTFIGIILMKYLNYYFNFGPMEPEAKDQFKDAQWWDPFSKWSWALFPNFQNRIENVGSNTVVVAEGVTWAGTNMAVTRQAIIINNISNGGLYIGLPVILIITIILALLHFFLGRKKIIALMATWTITSSTTKTKPAKKKASKKSKSK